MATAISQAHTRTHPHKSGIESLAEEGSVTDDLKPLLSTETTMAGSTKSALNGKAGGAKPSSTAPSQALMAGACFCLASGSMTLLNKAALSSFHFQATEALLFFQCFVAVVLVQLFKIIQIALVFLLGI